jgi:hypothetical protein
MVLFSELSKFSLVPQDHDTKHATTTATVSYRFGRVEAAASVFQYVEKYPSAAFFVSGPQAYVGAATGALPEPLLEETTRIACCVRRRRTLAHARAPGLAPLSVALDPCTLAVSTSVKRAEVLAPRALAAGDPLRTDPLAGGAAVAAARFVLA